MRARLAMVLAAAFLAASSCSRPVDLARSCKLQAAETGWYDAGITEDGKNKLVPTIVFRVSNTGSTALGQVQFNCLFKRVGDREERSEVVLRGANLGSVEAVPRVLVVRVLAKDSGVLRDGAVIVLPGLGLPGESERPRGRAGRQRERKGHQDGQLERAAATVDGCHC